MNLFSHVESGVKNHPVIVIFLNFRTIPVANINKFPIFAPQKSGGITTTGV
jgi:hypothetical protein